MPEETAANSSPSPRARFTALLLHALRDRLALPASALPNGELLFTVDELNFAVRNHCPGDPEYLQVTLSFTRDADAEHAALAAASM